MPITNEELNAIEARYDERDPRIVSDIPKLIAAIREAQKSVSIPSEALVSREDRYEEIMKPLWAYEEETARKLNHTLLQTSEFDKVEAELNVIRECRNRIAYPEILRSRSLPAVSVEAPQCDAGAAMIQKVKDMRTVWETAAKQRGSAFSDRARIATQIITELEALEEDGRIYQADPS